MTYNLAEIFSKVSQHLSKRPRLRLIDLSQEFGVERHTIEKAVQAATAMSFREYQKKTILKRALSLLRHAGESGEKEIAAMLGYRSTDALARLIKTGLQ
jgi:AraC-like DNA-binding protein